MMKVKHDQTMGASLLQLTVGVADDRLETDELSMSNVMQPVNCQ